MAFTFTKRGKGRTNRRTPGVMNKTEAAYAAHLELLKNTGQILGWKYESLTFTLAKLLSWKPDFVVQVLSGDMECHEVKGLKKERKGVPGKADREEGPYIESQSLIKAKIAASQWPFRFVVVYPDGAGGWNQREIEAA